MISCLLHIRISVLIKVFLVSFNFHICNFLSNRNPDTYITGRVAIENHWSKKQPCSLLTIKKGKRLKSQIKIKLHDFHKKKQKKKKPGD